MQRCPDAWSLTTTDDVRTHLSIFDIIPSAIDGHRGNESAMFLNHDLLGMFKAMAAHKSQSRWCASYLFLALWSLLDCRVCADKLTGLVCAVIEPALSIIACALLLLYVVGALGD